MKRILGIFIRAMTAGFLLLLMGCSVDEQVTESKPEKYCSVDVEQTDPELGELLVKIDRNKKEVKVNEPVEVTVDVKFDNLDISKDTIVDFEIIKNGVQVDKGNSEYVGDGKYIIKTMFSSPGQQQLVAHVYYEWFHEMPTLTFDVK